MNAPIFSASAIIFCICVIPLAVSVVSFILVRAWMINAPTGEEIPGVGLVLEEKEHERKS